MNRYFVALMFSIIISSFSQILLKKSSAKTYDSVLREYVNPYVICGYGMMFIALFLTILAYQGLDFTNVPVVEASGYVLIMVLSYFFFKERFTFRKILGMALILGGILVYHL